MRIGAKAATSWRVRGRTLTLSRPLIMGIVNVTPDSFSDGGQFFSPSAAVARALRMRAEGADIIDIGGESTRPQGAVPVDSAEELRRVIPVITAPADAIPDAVLTVDTVKADVASRAMDAGAHAANHASAFRLGPRLGETWSRHGA